MGLERDIVLLKQEIEEKNTTIQELRDRISELETKNEESWKQVEKLNSQIEVLEEKLTNKKERWDVQIQTGYKTKNRACQTTEVPGGALSSFGHFSDGAMDQTGQHLIDQEPSTFTTMTQAFGGRPRIQSAHRTILPDSSSGEGGDSMRIRPPKSAVNRQSRHIIQGNMIVEEVDYQNQEESDIFHDDETQSKSRPSGLQIHRNERRQNVRLKHPNERRMTNDMSTINKHKPSNSNPGVLLGNLFYATDNNKAF